MTFSELVNHYSKAPFQACVDSRLVKPREVFFALKGARQDGHQFLADVAAKGAFAAVVSHDYAGPDYGLRLFFTIDPLTALQELAKWLLHEASCKVIAITGSYGKTTTKEFVSTLLKEKYTVFSTPGNSNSQIGLPLSLINHFHRSHQVAVLEMGMTHAGHIKKLVEIAPPDIAILTAVDFVHACHFESLEAIALAKGEIFSHPKTSLRILSADIKSYASLCCLSNARTISFSATQRNADYSLSYQTPDPCIIEYGQEHKIPALRLPGRHQYHNLLAAVAACRQLNFSWKEIQKAIPKLTLLEKRLEHISLHGILFVNDSYNANTASMKAALESLPQPGKGSKRIALLSEMLELGSFTVACHEEVGRFALNQVDTLICLGELCEPMVRCWKAARRPVKWFLKREEAFEELKQQAQEGDVVLLKGANSHALWRFFEREK